MYKTLPGIYHNGVVHLNEEGANLPDGPVLVTFLEGKGSSTEPPLTPEEAADLRGKLAAWEQDWSAPGMELYDKP